MPKKIFKLFQPKLTCLDNESFRSKDFLHNLPSGKNLSSPIHNVIVSYCIVGFLPSVDVDAHRVQVSVRGGDGDGQLSPRDERW